MFTKDDLQTLVNLEAEGPMLSVYLNTNPAENSPDTYKLRLRSLLDEVDLPEDVQAVQQYFDHQYNWNNFRSAVVFSNQEDDYFQAFPLAVDVDDEIQINPFPYISPLASMLDAFSGNGVVLVDQEKARLFVFQMGELIQEEKIQGEEIQRQKHGGGSQTLGAWRGDEGEGEYTDVQSGRNMRNAARQADRFFTKHDVRRVILGGTEKNVSAFREMLSKSWQSLIIGTIQVDMNAAHNQIQERILEIVCAEDARRKESLLDTVITEAAKGRNGLVRSDDVLGAVREGRVQTLIIDESYQQPGYRCQGCGYLTTQDLGNCPFCEGTFYKIEDVGEMAVRRVLASGGRVEVFKGDNPLQERGGIGALLRY